MTWEQGSKYVDIANDYRLEKQFRQAGDHYTKAAYEYLGDSTLGPDRSDGSAGLHYLIMAATCYMLDDLTIWSKNRCRQGIIITEEVIDRTELDNNSAVGYEHARRGAWYEYIGDFRLLANLDGVDEAYEQSKDIYRQAGDPDLAIIEQEHMRLLWFFRRVALGAGFNLDEFYKMQHHAEEGTLTQWVEYKRQCLPDLLDELVDLGEWSYEDNDE